MSAFGKFEWGELIICKSHAFLYGKQLAPCDVSVCIDECRCRCKRSTYTVHRVRATRALFVMYSTRDMMIKMVLNNDCLIKMLIIPSFSVIPSSIRSLRRHREWEMTAQRFITNYANSNASHFVYAHVHSIYSLPMNATATAAAAASSYTSPFKQNIKLMTNHYYKIKNLQHSWQWDHVCVARKEKQKHKVTK